MVSVSSVYTSLVDAPNFEKDVVPYVVDAIIGGGLMTETQMMRLESAYKNASFVNGYGQTESSVDICLTRPSDTVEKRVKTVGRPFSAKKVLIIDENGKELKQGEAGEIAVVDEGNLMLGYYNLPEEKQSIDKNGLLHTGDMGYFDEEGYLVLSGRIKDIITKSGENISPIEIERIIIEDENVKDVKVMGAPHHYFGESIEACVVLKDKTKFDEVGIKNNIKSKLSSFKVPNNFYIMDSFPLNANGKLEKNAFSKESDINVVTILGQDMLTFGVHYEGEYKDLKEVITDDGMIKIILKLTDSITITEFNGKKYYYLEFLYPKNVDVLDTMYKESL